MGIRTTREGPLPHGRTNARLRATDPRWSSSRRAFVIDGDALMRWLTRLLRRDEASPLGRRGELAAARFLKKRGFRIVASRARSRLGELDLVAVDGRTVVFVEVKTWRRARDESPADAVDPAKQDRLTRAALTFLKAHGLLETASRFDVVTVTWPKHARQPSIEHFPNAFQPTGRWQFFS